jgi:phage shock protein PspC (stress-responsive transcriptional regulator)
MKNFKRTTAEERKAFGICGGLGRYTDTDPVLWRMFFIALWFTPFPITLFYILTTIVTDKE